MEIYGIGWWTAEYIALRLDVNKMKLLLIGKRENVIMLQEIYDSISKLFFKAIRQS